MLKTERQQVGELCSGMDLKAEIRKMCKEKDAIILAH